MRIPTIATLLILLSYASVVRADEPLAPPARYEVQNSSHKYVATLDPKTGVAQTTLKLGAPAYIAPAAYNGALYVLTDNGQLICIR